MPTYWSDECPDELREVTGVLVEAARLANLFPARPAHDPRCCSLHRLPDWCDCAALRVLDEILEGFTP